MIKIPIFALDRQYAELKKEIDPVIDKVLKEGIFILGENVSKFEKEFASYLGAKYAVGVGSGTDALTLAIRALDLRESDEVLVPANAYPTAFGVAQSGVTVRLVDCGEDGNISLADLSKRITKRTKAIIPVHLYGNPADVWGIKRVIKEAGRSDVAIIEDCAQAHGAEIRSPGSRSRYIKAGCVGDIGCFSFYPTKNLGAYGDGGMVVTKSRKLAGKVKELRMYGETTRYQSQEISGVSRLDELQAAILRVKLKHLDRWNKRRKDMAKLYEKRLHDVPGITLLSTKSGSVRHVFAIRAAGRNKLKNQLARYGIGSAVHYPIPIHLSHAFKHLGYKMGDFPWAEKLSREVLSLPLYPELNETEVDKISHLIRKFMTKGNK